MLGCRVSYSQIQYSVILYIILLCNSEITLLMLVKLNKIHINISIALFSSISYVSPLYLYTRR